VHIRMQPVSWLGEQKPPGLIDLHLAMELVVSVARPERIHRVRAVMLVDQSALEDFLGARPRARVAMGWLRRAVLDLALIHSWPNAHTRARAA
jgi:hypothetical protein